MLVAKTKDAVGWKTLTGLIRELNEEAIFNCTDKGIIFKVLDIGTAAFIDFTWPKESFEKYECTENLRLGIKVADFLSIINRADKKDSIEITTDNKMMIKLGERKEYGMSLINSLVEERNTPNATFDVTFKINLKDLQEILEDISIVNDFIAFKSTKDKMEFLGKGEHHDAKVTIERTCEKEVETEYDISYLKNALKSVSAFVPEITVSFALRGPLKLEFPVSGLGTIDFYLAPHQIQ